MLLFGRPSEIEILRVALDMSLEWGENWLRPINDRIKKRYAFLTDEQAEALNKKCKEIQSYCWNDLCWKEADGKLTLDDVRRLMNEKYPEIGESNLSRLISQGCYYARK